MKRLSLAAAAMVLTLSCLALGDTVYLKDGRQFTGTVTKKDGKVFVETALGTLSFKDTEVIYVDTGTVAASKPVTTAPEVTEKTGPVSISGTVRWDPSACTLAEAMLFMTARQGTAGFGDAPDTSADTSVKQWKIYAHEGRRRLGNDWLNRDEQRRRRAAYEKAMKDASAILSQARNLNPQIPADVAKKKDLDAKANKALKDAISAWPDAIIQDFLLGMIELQAKNYAVAETHFRRCEDAEPLVAAFHQARGLAQSGQKQPVQALGEFITLVQLRDDDYAMLNLLETAMKDIPGARTSDPLYKQAHALLDRYEQPKNPYHPLYGGTPWMMPGKPWQWRDDQAFTPPYDRVVTKQTIAVPIADNVLVVDDAAVAGADQIYIEISPGTLVYAEPLRSYSYSTTAKTAAPLSAIKVFDATFTPVDTEKPAALKKDQDVVFKNVNCFRQMGTGLQSTNATVTSDDGKTFSLSPQPGASLGVVLAGGEFAGFMGGRTDFEADDYGKGVLLKAADVSAALDPIKRSLRYSSGSTRYGRPVVKGDAEKPAAEGKFFIVHILIGEKPPAQVGN